MYIARNKIEGLNRFYIRESFLSEGIYQARDLMDLGEDPRRFIKYIDQRAFYIDECVEDRLRENGAEFSQDDIEDIFWPYIRPDVRYRYRYARSKSKNDMGRKTESHHFHIFDRRRLHFLKFGQMDQSHIYSSSPKMFQVLDKKSRDELEQHFILNENILKPKEMKSYVYVIFDLQKYFGKTYAREMPQVLDQKIVDEHFLKDICRLNKDEQFWAGDKTGNSLHDYLKRYIIMFFDSTYAETRFFDDKLYDWINNKRFYRPFPFKTKEKIYNDASKIFGTSSEDLKKMSKRELSKLYRKKAREFHPDHGGSHEDFVRLSKAYDEIVSGK